MKKLFLVMLLNFPFFTFGSQQDSEDSNCLIGIVATPLALLISNDLLLQESRARQKALQLAAEMVKQQNEPDFQKRWDLAVALQTERINELRHLESLLLEYPLFAKEEEEEMMRRVRLLAWVVNQRREIDF